MDRLLPKTLTGREQSTFSVWSSPSSSRSHLLMAMAGAPRIAALRDGWTWTPEGFAFWLAGTLHRRCACGEELALLLRDKRPQSCSLIAGWSVAHPDIARHRCRLVSRVSLSHVALKTSCWAINSRLLDHRCLSKFSRPLAIAHDRDIK